MIKCIVFDLDGTLIDTLKDLGVTTNEILIEYGYSSIEIDKYRYFVGDGIRKLIERAILEVNGDINLLDEIYNKFTSNYKNKCLRFASLYDGVFELVNTLKEKGYLLYINTNKNHEIAVKMINNLLPNIFIDVYGDSIDYPRKPNPLIVNRIKIMNNLNDDEVLYVGDSNVDVFTAKNANIKVVGCKYGFRGEKELLSSGADFLISEPLDLLKIINN